MIKGREMRRVRRKYGWIDVIRLRWIRVEAEGGNKFEGRRRKRKEEGGLHRKTKSQLQP